MRVLSTFVSIILAASASAVEIIAHRGASLDAPENTLPAFRLAWDQGADAIELDVWLTHDGRIAVIHDATTKRTGGLDRKIAKQTLADLQKLDAGSWKGPQWKSTRIPALEHVLSSLPETKRAFIEIKCGPEILPELVRVIGSAPCKPGQLVIIGFSYETLRQAKALLPHIEAHWIVQPKKGSRGTKPTTGELISMAGAARFDGLDLNSGFAIDSAFVTRVHAANLKLGVWTVDQPHVAERLKAAGVDSITTNRPALLRDSKNQVQVTVD